MHIHDLYDASFSCINPLSLDLYAPQFVEGLYVSSDIVELRQFYGDDTRTQTNLTPLFLFYRLEFIKPLSAVNPKCAFPMCLLLNWTVQGKGVKEIH